MKIVLFGKNGQLGWEFQRMLPILGEVISFDSQEQGRWAPHATGSGG